IFCLRSDIFTGWTSAFEFIVLSAEEIHEDSCGMSVAGRPHRRFKAEEASEPCLAVGAIGSRPNNLRHERQRPPFFVSEHLLVADKQAPFTFLSPRKA